MARKYYNNQYLKTIKEGKNSKGGYKVNKNGMPVSIYGESALSPNTTSGYNYKGMQKTGRYKPTVHNISII